MIDKRLTNPAFIAGKLHYWEGIPCESINHCAPEVKAAWLDGWEQARAEHLLVRSQITGNRRNFLAVDGVAIL
jgi:ribosome modulation factor